MDGQERYRFFQHRACEFFPCHKGVEEEQFSCLFCYCPLYALGKLSLIHISEPTRPY